MSENYNTYIIKHSFKSFFVASVLTSLINIVDGLTDSVIVSNFVSPDSISVIGLLNPVFSILFLFSSMIVTGSVIIVAKYIGQQDYIKTKRVFTACFTSVVITYMILSIVIICNSNWICELITVEPRLLPLLKDYLPWTVVGSFVSTILYVILGFIKAGGNPKLVTYTVLVFCVANILFDLLFVGYMDMGIKGSAVASPISNVIAIFISGSYLIKKGNMFKLVRPEKSWYNKYLQSSIKFGLPSALGAVFSSALYIVLNNLILKSQGADGMFVLTVGLQVLSICTIVLSATSGAISGIGGVLIGEMDIERFRTMVSRVFVRFSLVMVAITCIVEIYPDPLVVMFGASDELISNCRQPLRQLLFMLWPQTVLSLVAGIYNIQGKSFLATITNVVSGVCMIGAAIISTMFFPDYIWIAVPASVWLSLLIIVALSWCISHKDKSLHWLTLITKTPNNPHVSFSISYNKDELEKTLKQIESFVEICELGDDMNYKIRTCIEELAYNIIDMNKKRNNNGYFDIRVVDAGEKILVVIKDNNIPYDPIKKFEFQNDDTPKESDLPLVLVNGMCSDINYQYMNGINCVYMNFKY